MRFTIARGALLDALGVVTKALSSRTTLPILSGLLVTAADGTVVLQATDLEISIKDSVAAEVEEKGAAVLPGRLLSDVARKMPDAAILVETTSFDRVSVSCRSEKAGVISFELRTLPADDFPRFPEVDPELTVEIPVQQLGVMVRQVAKAVSHDEARPILTGILLLIEGDEIKMVATDSYRLAIRASRLETAAPERIEVVVPGKALEEVPKVSGSAQTVTMGVSANQIVFTAGETTYVTRRIEGTFPNYGQLVPSDGTTRMTVDRAELLEAAQRVSLLAQHNAPVRMKIAESTLTLSAVTQDVGEASEDLMVETSGEPLEIAFNHVFLIDGVASSDDERLTFVASGPLKPGVFSASEAGEYTYLIMPVRP
jgi:DNA polymerase III subunit beta